MKLVLLLFGDGTWNACYENQIDDFIEHHKWKSDIFRRAVKIIDAIPGEDRELETLDEFRERRNKKNPLDNRKDLCYTIITKMIEERE